MQKIYNELGGNDLQICFESGRYMTGPFGYLITSVTHYKETYKKYVGVDACMANLMRPGMYNSYHHIIVMNKENNSTDKVYDIVGPLCENNDKFAIDRNMPEINIGDILIICDAGAHGFAMGFNYNGRLRSPEFLYNSETGEVKKIRRAETEDDYFRTLLD